MVMRFELPRDLITYSQECGRAARVPGTVATCLLYANVESYSIIMKQILSIHDISDEGETIEQLEIQGIGSAITPLSASARRRLELRHTP